VVWRLILFEAVALLVVAGVWFGAPLVGITSVLWRIVIILALLIPPIALIVYLHLQQRKAASGLESAIKEQGRARAETVRPDRRAEVQALGQIFEEAIAALKKSRLAQGRNALYALPWYMIIGPPAVGKSTALLHSGLKFPFTTGDRKAVKGVGGTRNCDWWFSDQAILLDTAGRYTSEDDDQEEWLGFLRLLKKYRRRRPLNGLIVAYSVSDLMKATPEELEEQAAQIRSRIDQITGELELALPVYVLFTKCDLISGFIQLFGNLTKSARSQIFGFTVPLTTPATSVEELFAEELELLIGRLHQRALGRLASAKPSQRSEVYQFPLQFASVRDQFSSFVAHLMAANPYLESPRLRGVYFCSGTQEGRPLDRILGGMSRALGLKELAVQSFEQGTQKKSYFLKNVFTEVLFPDQNLAGTTAAGLSRRRRLGIAALAATALVSVSLVAPTVVSFSNNRELIASAVEVSKNSRITTPEDPRRVLDGLEALDRLGRHLDELRRNEADGPPWSLGLGFYQGDRLLTHVERVYVRRMHQAFVLPAGTEVEATLIDIAGSPDSSARGAAAEFDLLKTYLMVTEPKRLEISFAIPILLTQWKKRLHPEVSQNQELLTTNASRLLKLLKEGKARWLERDKEIVRKVRRTLIGRDTQYQTLVVGVDVAVRPLTLRDALRGRIQTAVLASEEVPGVYTRAAWNDYIRKRLAKRMVTGSTTDAWVLGEEKGKDAASQLKERYFERYIVAWQRFLRGLSLPPAITPEQSLSLLEKLTEPPALYEELFNTVAYNTELPLTDEKTIKAATKMLRGKAGRLISKAERLGLDKAIPKRKLNRVERAFQALHELVSTTSSVDGRPQVSGLRQYLAQLENVRNELAKEVKGVPSGEGSGMDRALEEAQRVAKGVLATLPGDLRRIVGPLFYTPLEIASTKASEAQANRASAGISDDLCPAFAERLAGRYPFGRGKEDALLQEVVAFFSSKGTVWTHYETTLKGQLVRKGNAFQPVPGKNVPGHVVAFFNKAWQISRALFPTGSDRPQLRFQVRPHPAILQTGASYQVSEIVLDVEGKSQTYRNGPPEQWAFEWTGQDKPSALVIRGAGGLYEKISFGGEWGLRRLIERGKVRKRGSWYSVVWPVKGGKVGIPMDFRPERTYNPLFMSMRLPCR
jgi:type VI secretion system protein ImpL